MSVRSVAAMVGGGAASLVAAGWLEAHAFRVVRHEVTLPVGAAAPSRVRILHLSDIHYMRGQAAKARFVASLVGLEPDLVILTGDLLSDDGGFDEFIEALSSLFAVPGAFVFGSNDYFGPTHANPLAYLFQKPGQVRPGGRALLSWRPVRDAMLATGWCDLNNARRRLDVAGLTVELRGAGDAHIGLDDYAAGAPVGDVSAGRPADLVLGVTHAPYRRVLDAMVADGVPLILAGHTHGGQICLPWGAIVTNCDLPPAMAKGLWRYRGASWLHVTAGVGTAPTFPLRLFCRPEACLLEVTLV